ncbi:FecR family protein [Bradyrhizobium genosp. A]|uniref:FecR family protein n=1 Tax=Bradyrhizobium genosp. A TaxID=83626 RepID=UPI003CEC9003
MSESSDQLPEIEPLTQEAIDWVVRLKSGEATTADAEALRRWRSESAAHEEAFRCAVKLWRDFKIVAEQSPARPAAPEATRVAPWANRRIARRAFLGGAIAASAAGYVIVRPPLGLWPSLHEMSADYRTVKGEQRQVALGSDISLTLNTLTSIAVRSTDEQPRIELISGEAAVVAKAPSAKPLVMTIGTGRVIAARADFNARCVDDLVSVTCLSGAVTVEQGQQSVQLRSNQQISYSSIGLRSATTADPVQATSWQSGLLVFHDKLLSDVVDEINRYRPGRIVITSTDLRRRVVNATFHLDQLDNFLVQAQELFGAKVTQLPAGLTLLG